MSEHRDACPACARTEAAERALSGLFASAREATVRDPRELWPLIAARLERPVAKPRYLFGSQRWALGGALAAGALCAALWFGRPGSTGGVTPPAADETRAVTLAAAIQELPDPDREFTGDSSQHVPLLQRAVLVGGGGR